MQIEEYFHREHEMDFSKGIIAGIAGGLLASLLMEQFQALWNTAAEKIAGSGDAGESPRREATPATVKVAQSVSKKVFGRKIPKAKREVAGEAVHYTMGIASGAIYGALTEISPVTTIGDGLAFGTAVWVLADEVSVPKLGLSDEPKKIPLATHFYALVSHLVYGWVTEIVRRAVRKAL